VGVCPGQLGQRAALVLLRPLLSLLHLSVCNIVLVVVLVIVLVVIPAHALPDSEPFGRLSSQFSEFGLFLFSGQ